MNELAYALIGLLIIFIILIAFRKRINTKKVNFVLLFAFVLIFFGIFYNDKPAIGYSLLSVGSIIAIIERIYSRRKE